MRVTLLTLLVVFGLVFIGTAAATQTRTNATSQLKHSTDVVQFFHKHKWLMAPRKENCRQVPWSHSCRIARDLVQQHTERIKKIKHALWVDYHYNWRAWLPENWRRVGTCETGYGGDPNFNFANGSFVSAFGISRAIYDSDARYAGMPPWNDANPPTPRQQYLTALGHYAQYGDGWGCPGP